MAEGTVSAEKILDTDLQLSSECKKQDKKVLETTVLSDTEHRSNAPATGIETIESKEEHSMVGGASGASGLRILSNQELQEDDDGSSETTVSPSQKGDQQRGTSEITDEGAVKKLDSGKAGEETLQLPKPYRGRPGAGCRLMVEVSIPTTVSLKKIEVYIVKLSRVKVFLSLEISAALDVRLCSGMYIFNFLSPDFLDKHSKYYV